MQDKSRQQHAVKNPFEHFPSFGHGAQKDRAVCGGVPSVLHRGTLGALDAVNIYIAIEIETISRKTNDRFAHI